MVDDLVEERCHGVQQGIEYAAELGRRLGCVQSRAVGAQIRRGEALVWQGVPGAEGGSVATGPAAQVAPGGGSGVVGADLVGGAADVVVQLEVGIVQGYSTFRVSFWRVRSAVVLGGLSVATAALGRWGCWALLLGHRGEEAVEAEVLV